MSRFRTTHQLEWDPLTFYSADDMIAADADTLYDDDDRALTTLVNNARVGGIRPLNLVTQGGRRGRGITRQGRELQRLQWNVHHGGSVPPNVGGGHRERRKAAVRSTPTAQLLAWLSDNARAAVPAAAIPARLLWHGDRDTVTVAVMLHTPVFRTVRAPADENVLVTRAPGGTHAHREVEYAHHRTGAPARGYMVQHLQAAGVGLTQQGWA